MYRTLLSLVAVVLFLGAHAGSAAAQNAAKDAAQETRSGKGSSRAAKPSTKPEAAGTVNINTASASALEALPGIGAKTAALIVEYRQKNGPFKKVEELMNVRGVGEKSFLKLKPQITVAAQKSERTASQQ